MKQPVKAVLAVLAAAIVVGGASGLSYMVNQGDSYIGTVDGEKISRADFDKALDQIKKQYVTRFGMDFNSPQGRQMLAGLQHNLIDQLTDRTLLLQEAHKRGITVTDDEVNAKIAELRKDRFPDDASFNKALQDAGITMAELRTEIREGLSVQKLMKAVAGNIQVSDDQIAAYYQHNPTLFTHPEEIRASHILVKTEAQAEAIEKQLKAGASFPKLAEQDSLDPGSKQSGGDLGWFKHGQMVPEFDKAAFALTDGQISQPIKTSFGYHVIERTGTRPAGTEPLAQVKDQIRDMLVKQQEQAKFQAFLANLKKNAVIAILPKYEPAMPPQAPPPGFVPMQPQGAPAAKAAPDHK